MRELVKTAVKRLSFSWSVLLYAYFGPAALLFTILWDELKINDCQLFWVCSRSIWHMLGISLKTSPALERRDRGGEQRTEDRWMWLRSDRKECEILTFLRHLRKHYAINQRLSEIYLTLVIGIFPQRKCWHAFCGKVTLKTTTFLLCDPVSWSSCCGCWKITGKKP